MPTHAHLQPDIERFYGQRKPIAKRVRYRSKTIDNVAGPSTMALNNSETGVESSTPAITDASTATTETELETETEIDEVISPTAKGLPNVTKPTSTINKPKPSRHQPQLSVASSTSSQADSGHRRAQPALSQHDLMNKYFRRDAVVFKNIDLLRFVFVRFQPRATN